MFKIARVLIMIMAIGPAFSAVEKKSFTIEGLEILEVKNGSGDVDIEASNLKTAEVVANKIQFGTHCQLEMKRSGSKLIVEAKQKGWIKKGNCQVSFKIKVPKRIKLDLKVGSGDLEVEGTSGPVEVRVGSGEVDIEANVEQLLARSGSGDVEVEGLVGNADVRSGSGDLSLTYFKAPKSGKLEIKTGSGNAKVQFPADTKIRSGFMAGSGKLYNELGDSKDAGFEVKMMAGSGNLKIEKLKKKK